VPGAGVSRSVLNLSTVRPDVFPHRTTFDASSTVGMWMTHSLVDLSIPNEKFRLLATHATRGGSNSIIVCHDIGMMFVRPLAAVVSIVTGPGSSSP
jgi:hypothetical protein